MPKRRSPVPIQAASPPVGGPPQPPTGPPLAPAFNRRILPKEVKKAIADAGIGDLEIPLFWAAYERGRQDEREGRLSAIEQRLAAMEGAGMGWRDAHDGGPEDPYADPRRNGSSSRPSDDNLPPRPDLDAMDRAKASRAAGQEPLRILKVKEPNSQTAAGLELPIGRYPAELVTDLVKFAQENSTNPARARDIMRDYLVECEPTCTNPPSSTGKTVLLKLQTEKILKGEQVTRLGSLEDMDEAEVAGAVASFGGGEGE